MIQRGQTSRQRLDEDRRRARSDRDRESEARNHAVGAHIGERGGDQSTHVNTVPEDLEDAGYQSLEADAGDADDIRAEAEELAVVNANEPLDEDVEDGDPTQLQIPTENGGMLEMDIKFPPETERQPASNADQPLVRAPDGSQPETAGHNIGDQDIEGNWPDE